MPTIDYNNPPVSDYAAKQKEAEIRAIRLTKEIGELVGHFDKLRVELDRVPGCSGPTLIYLSRAQLAAAECCNNLGAAHLEIVRYLEGEEAGGGKARAIIPTDEKVDTLGYVEP